MGYLKPVCNFMSKRDLLLAVLIVWCVFVKYTVCCVLRNNLMSNNVFITKIYFNSLDCELYFKIKSVCWSFATDLITVTTAYINRLCYMVYNIPQL